MARDEARCNQSPPTPEAKPKTKGCVFAKSCDLPDGLINYSNPSGFIPVELLTQYGDFAMLGSDSVNESLAWIGGSSSAKTRARLHVERLPDNSARSYGFYTGKDKDWENVPVVAATADGARFVIELGQGTKLILSPGTTAPMPVLRDAQPLPPVWVYPPSDIAKKMLDNPVHPPAYQDLVVWFPETDIPPFYISFCIPKTCPHPDMMEELAQYIAGEMNRNIHDPAVLEMKQLIHCDPIAEAKKWPTESICGPF
ncbi:S-type pyocin domain-containing protein [Pseudomonas sp. NFX224]|uniref:S-type pyocin domain-containing protein n=1 Tax=Pseudomonas sp. NFX224 TaxID=3402862 RepID=UPI003AFA84A8